MQSRTPAAPAQPWARSMALAVRRERRPRIGVSRPRKPARARKPVERLPKSPAGKPSPSGVPFSRTTINSRAPKPSSRCNPISIGLRMPRRCRTSSTSPMAMAPRGRRINGNTGMSAPDRECEQQNSTQDRPQSLIFAMAPGGVEALPVCGRRQAKITARATRAGLPEMSFCRKFGADFWSAWRGPAKADQPKFAAHEFNKPRSNTNRQARTS